MSDLEKTLHIGVVAPIAALDPATVLDATTEGVIRQIFETPFATIDPLGTTRPHLFRGPLETLPAEAGRNVFAGHLIPDLLFSDGSPVTLEDAAAALRIGLSPLEEELEVRVADGALRFSLPRTRTWLERSLSNLKCALRVARNGRLLGTGPFREISRQGIDAVELGRNPYYRRPVRLERLHYRRFPPDADGLPTRLIEAMKSGAVDLTMDLTRVDPGKLQGFRQQLAMGYSTCLLFFNTERAPFDDVRIRRAATQAIDRFELTKIFYQRALAFVASSALPPALGRFADGLSANLPAARATIERLAPPRRPLRMLIPWAPRPYLPDPGKGARYIAERFGLLGFGVELIVPTTIDDFSRHASSADYDLVLAGWQLETLDPGEFLEVHLATSLIPEIGKPRGNRTNNLGRYSSPEMDAALFRYRDAPSRATLDAVMALTARDIPFLPLLYGGTLLVHAPSVRNLRMMLEGVPILAEAERAD